MSDGKRLSPGQLNEALAMVSADGGLRDDLAGHIAALEAEIARLRPSGQVAADVAEANALALIYCRDYCADDGPEDERHTERCWDAREAIARLGAWERRGNTHLEVLEAVCEVLGTEPSENVVTAAKRLAAKAQGYDAAVADNAEMVKTIGKLVKGDMMEGVTAAHRILSGLEPHPGAALLEQHRKEVAEARNEGLEEAAAYFDKAAALWVSFHAGTIAAKHAEAIRALKKETT